VTSKLVVQSLYHTYVDKRAGISIPVLENINISVEENEFVSIVGPSGCGKSTLLYIIAGLIKPTSGKIMINGKEITNPSPDRTIVFQNPTLFPWRTVLRNVTYGLEAIHLSMDEAEKRAMKFIELVGLKGFENYYPNRLSGGMQQRVNLARALVTNPEILLMDEPFAALDAQTREYMQTELLRIWSETRRTVIFVTHQIDESVYLSDKVIILSSRPGKIKKIIDVDLERPRNPELKRTTKFVRLVDEVWSYIERTI
jgi:NitT/TauT family transport system ATP-binding protein